MRDLWIPARAAIVLYRLQRPSFDIALATATSKVARNAALPRTYELMFVVQENGLSVLTPDR